MTSGLARFSLRQLAYLVLIIVLLVPLSMLSQPTSGDGKSAGGRLAQLRAEHKLGDTNVGAIDPRSETIRLVSLGLGGIANVILWTQADEYKNQEDWTAYRAVLDNLIHLQPYYPVVWEHQAWNLSYNISAEFDDYRDKYYWVMDGIRFLQRGTTYLENNPRLLQRTGWFVTHKIGRSDERTQFRRLFAQDDDFHRDQRIQERDNWLFGRGYYQLGNDAVDLGGATLNFMEPILFYSDKIRAQMFSGDALASDYHLQLENEAIRTTDPTERSRRFAELDTTILRQIRGRWATAQADIQAFADRTFVAEDGTQYRLSEYPTLEQQRLAKTAELESVAGTVRDRLRDQKRKRLTPAELSALTVDSQARNEEQTRLAHDAESKLAVSDQELLEQIDLSQRAAVQQRLTDLHDLENRAFRCERGRKLIELDYWLLRCRLEQGEDARNAARHFSLGAVAYKIDTDLATAKRELESGFQLWRKLLDQHPELLRDQTGYNVLDHVNLYRQTLRQLDEPFPKPFILDDLVKALQ